MPSMSLSAMDIREIYTILIANIFVFNHIIILNDFMLKIKLQILIIMITFPLFDYYLIDFKDMKRLIRILNIYFLKH